LLSFLVIFLDHTASSTTDVSGGADAAVLQAVESSSRARAQREDGTGEMERRIRDQLLDPDAASPSPYDTAWVAMVPSSSSPPRAPRFPRCLDWILRNQNADGSWRPKLDGAGAVDPSLVKDALSSTMACVLALTTWGVGDRHVKKGSLIVITRRFDRSPAGRSVVRNTHLMPTMPSTTQGSISSGKTSHPA
jgi:hypothetical protein